MRHIITLCLTAILTITASAQGISWTSDYAEGLEKAARENKGVLLDFTAEWCGWCEKMDAEVFSEADIAAMLQDYVCIKVDIDKNPNVAQAYQVKSIPRVISLNVHREVIGDHMGYQPAPQFAALLQGQNENLRIATGGTPAPEVELPATAAELQTEMRRQVAVEGPMAIVAMLGDPDPRMRDLAIDEALHAGDTAIPALVKGLADEYLGIRIAALFALKQVDAGAPDFDPWAEKPQRDEALAVWKDWLSTRLASTFGEGALADRTANAVSLCKNLDTAAAETAIARGGGPVADTWSWIVDDKTIITATDTNGDAKPDNATIFQDMDADFRLEVDVAIADGAPTQKDYRIEYIPRARSAEVVLEQEAPLDQEQVPAQSLDSNAL